MTPEQRENKQCAQHDLVVEIREGDHIGMRCIPCRSVIAVRPIRAAAGLDELNGLGREHVGGPVDPPGGEDELREAIVRALVRAHPDASFVEIADALLPVVLTREATP